MPHFALTLLNSKDGWKNPNINKFHESYKNTLNQFENMLWAYKIKFEENRDIEFYALYFPINKVLSIPIENEEFKIMRDNSFMLREEKSKKKFKNIASSNEWFKTMVRLGKVFLKNLKLSKLEKNQIL